MKAVVFHEHGGVDKLHYVADFPDPAYGDDEVLVRVKAVSLNYLDIFSRRGMPGIKIPFPMITGGDIAGTVEKLGRNVSGWQTGDRVSVYPIDWVRGGMVGESKPGGMAELVNVHKTQLIALSPKVSFEDAASLPVAYGTAYRMVLVRGQIKKGEKVLVLGASGGVGTGVVLLAKMLGAEVVACASSDDKLQRLKEIGADHLINYAKTDFVKECHRLCGKPKFVGGSEGIDVVINYTGGETWAQSLRVLKKGGRMLTCGATAGFDPNTENRYIWTFELNVMGSNGWYPEDQQALLKLVEEGKLKPVIDKVMPLTEAREAERIIEDREVFGKIVLVP
jgi:alcohol dehydrogenase